MSFMLSVNNADYRKQGHYTECRYAECRYAECRGALVSICYTDMLIDAIGNKAFE
jgi:hypothetical protein